MIYKIANEIKYVKHNFVSLNLNKRLVVRAFRDERTHQSPDRSTTGKVALALSIVKMNESPNDIQDVCMFLCPRFSPIYIHMVIISSTYFMVYSLVIVSFLPLPRSLVRMLLHFFLFNGEHSHVKGKTDAIFLSMRLMDQSGRRILL